MAPPGTSQTPQKPHVVQAPQPDRFQITDAIQVFTLGSKTCAHWSGVKGELGFIAGFQQASRI